MGDEQGRAVDGEATGSERPRSVVPPELAASSLASFFEQVAIPLHVKDSQLRYVLVNRAFERLVGAEASQLLGRRESELCAPEVAEPAEAADRAVLADAAVTNVVDVTTGGMAVVLETTKTPLYDSSGAVTHVVTVIHDITELKRSELALRRLAEELEGRVVERTMALKSAQEALLRNERLAVLGQLAAGLAHQLRNPLASIANATSVLQRCLRNGLEDDANTSAGIIREEVFEANRIITDLLDYARIRPARLLEVDAREVIDLALASEPVPDGVRLELAVPAELTFLADATQAATALRKLLRNAFEAVGVGGAVRVVGDEADGRVVLSVVDDGPGLSPKEQEKVFEPLVSSKPWGLGLGLATARALAENQAATLAVESRSGHGARFALSFPRGER